jgi:TRAP-type C4-dicarboxylate transport system permease small subunit
VSGPLARAHRRLLDGLGLAAGVALGLLAVLISVDVVRRSLGHGSIGWLLEVSEYTLFVATFAAAPWVLRQGAHVRVDLLLAVVPRAVARALELVADGIGLAVSLLLVLYGARAAHDAFARGLLVFKELVIPEWWLLAVIPVAALLLVIEFGLRIGGTLRQA